MTIPVELIIWIGGANFGVVTLFCHILYSISQSQSRMETRQGIIEFKLGIKPQNE